MYMEKDKKMDKNDRLMAYFPDNGTFIVELEFKKDNEETARKILSSAVREEELLPDLKVKRLFRSVETIDSVTNISKRDILNEVIRIIDKLKQDVINFKLEEIDAKEYGVEYLGK